MQISNQKFIVIFVFFLSGLSGFMVSLYLHRSNPKLASTHYPAAFVKQLTNDGRAGEKIFNEFCSSCHAKSPIISTSATRIGNKTAWQPLRRLGIKNLLQITVNGAGAMPARGGCFECSDEQLKATIQYMLDRS